MSFLDDQATGQIGIGEKANLSTLTRRKRKRKKGQNPTGSETYSLMPQNEFSNIVSSPTDITQVGIGEKLQAQGTDASSVGNVFKDYTSAAPLGTTLEAIYYQPPPEEEEEDEDLPDIADDPLEIPSHDSGADEEGNPHNPDTPQSVTAMSAMAQDLFTGLNLGIGKELGLQVSGLFSKGEMMTNVVVDLFTQAEAGKLTDRDGNKVSKDDIWSVFSQIDDTRAGGTGGKDTTYEDNDPGRDNDFEVPEVPEVPGATMPTLGPGGFGGGFGSSSFGSGSGTTAGIGGPASLGGIGAAASASIPGNDFSLGPSVGGGQSIGTGSLGPSVGTGSGGTGSGGGGQGGIGVAAGQAGGDPGVGEGGGGNGGGGGGFDPTGGIDPSMLASGGTVKDKNKNSFMSMKGK